MFGFDDEERAGFRAGTIPVNMPKQLRGMQWRIETSVLDRTGCGNCADVCPGKKGNKALTMAHFSNGTEEATCRTAD